MLHKFLTTICTRAKKIYKCIKKYDRRACQQNDVLRMSIGGWSAKKEECCLYCDVCNTRLPIDMATILFLNKHPFICHKSDCRLVNYILLRRKYFTVFKNLYTGRFHLGQFCGQIYSKLYRIEFSEKEIKEHEDPFVVKVRCLYQKIYKSVDRNTTEPFNIRNVIIDAWRLIDENTKAQLLRLRYIHPKWLHEGATGCCIFENVVDLFKIVNSTPVK